MAPATSRQKAPEHCPIGASSFDDFCIRHKLSIRSFASIIGLSPTSAHRLLKGEAPADFITKHRAQIESGLRSFLAGRKLSSEGVAQELARLFTLEDAMPGITRVRLTPSACKFFGLKRDPFYLDPRTDQEYFTTAELDTISDQIEDAILNHGFLAVTGEIGSGKTALKQRILARLDDTQEMRVIWPEFQDMEEIRVGNIVSFILTEFDQKPRLDKLQRARQLRQLLADLHTQEISVALAFDEAHRLSDRVLSALKNFWEMGAARKGGYTRYLGIVLFGQPQFEGRLREFRFSEIAQRLEIVRMPPMQKRAADYVAHRIRLVGGDPATLFAAQALNELIRTASTPLALGNRVNEALMRAFELKEQRYEIGMLETDPSEPKIQAMRRRG
jgi:type II secretory pathway predicted ATPase ExeA